MDILKQLTPLPVFSLELTQLLSELFPQRCKKLNETVEEHAYYAGMANLAKLLRDAYAAEDEIAKSKPEDANCPEFYERFRTARVVVSTTDTCD